MRYIVLLTALFAAPFYSFAQSPLTKAEEKGIEFVKKDKIYYCSAEKQKIEEFLSEPQECGMDGDCSYFNYGYPWQPDSCRKAIVSSLEKNKTLQGLAKIEVYNENCINNNPEEKKKYDQLQKEIEQGQCDMIRLYCYKGYCRSKNYSVQINYDTPLRQLR